MLLENQFSFKILFRLRKVDYDIFVLTFLSFCFFQERAKLAYFDYGDVICKEGEMPQGIYLIISGMAIVRDYLSVSILAPRCMYFLLQCSRKMYQ